MFCRAGAALSAGAGSCRGQPSGASRLGRGRRARDVSRGVQVARQLRCAFQLSHLVVDDPAEPMPRPLSTADAQRPAGTVDCPVRAGLGVGLDRRGRRFAAGPAAGQGAGRAARGPGSSVAARAVIMRPPRLCPTLPRRKSRKAAGCATPANSEGAPPAPPERFSRAPLIYSRRDCGQTSGRWSWHGNRGKHHDIYLGVEP